MLTGPLAHLVPVGAGQALGMAAAAAAWAALGLIYHRGWSIGPGRSRIRLGSFIVGVGLVVVAISPPLEHLAEDLVSLHMVQHVILILVCAPLIAVGRPVETLLRGLPIRVRKRVGRLRRNANLTPSNTRRVARPLVVWMIYALAVWVWHGTVPYEMALSHRWLHGVEHGVFLVAALAFWSMVLVPRRHGAGTGYRILALFTTAFHSVLLGALFTFSDVAWYPSYANPTTALGLDPIADQRLAGLIMWIPGGLVYTGAGIWLVTVWLNGQADDHRWKGPAAMEVTNPVRHR